MTRISKSRISMEDGRIDRAYLRDYGETVVGGSAGTNAGSAYEVDMSQGNVFNLILNENNCSLTFTNAFPVGNATRVTLFLKQDSTGSRTVSWPSGVIWPGDTSPTLTTTPDEFDVVTLITVNAGALWFGVSGGSASPNLPVSLWTWGSTGSGVLGQNNMVNYSSPAQVGALTDWSNIATNGSHALVIKNNGTLWAWGSASGGQTGLGSNANRSSPTQVGSDTDWQAVTAGQSHSFAIKNNGTLWAWGSGGAGRTGFNDETNRSSPAQVGADTDWTKVAANDSTIAIKNDGTLWAWGTGSQGRSGLNDTLSRSSPAQIGALTDWASIACGTSHALAVKTDGTLWTWGYGTYGRTGHNDTAARSSPTQVGALDDWLSVAAGDSSRCFAVKTDGTLWAWGNHGYVGVLGLNDLVHRSSPTQIGTLTNWTTVATGTSHALALKTDGTLWGWGSAGSGILGNGVSSGNISSPVQIGVSTNWTDLAVGNATGLAKRSE